ncbi:hypothetical protein UACE39S_05147 [Ureibacillus acetophenoni]
MTMKVQIENAIDKISAIKGVGMEPKYLMLDVLALYSVYSDRFNIVVDEVIKAIEMIVNNPSLGQQLDFSLRDYKFYHFSSPGQLLNDG